MLGIEKVELGWKQYSESLAWNKIASISGQYSDDDNVLMHQRERKIVRLKHCTATPFLSCHYYSSERVTLNPEISLYISLPATQNNRASPLSPKRRLIATVNVPKFPRQNPFQSNHNPHHHQQHFFRKKFFAVHHLFPLVCQYYCSCCAYELFLLNETGFHALAIT